MCLRAPLFTRALARARLLCVRLLRAPSKRAARGDSAPDDRLRGGGLAWESHRSDVTSAQREKPERNLLLAASRRLVEAAEGKQA